MSAGSKPGPTARLHALLTELGVGVGMVMVTSDGSVRSLTLSERVELAYAAVPPLMGAYEAAATLGVATGNLYSLSGLPEPVAELRCGKIWRAADIEALAASRRRR